MDVTGDGSIVQCCKEQYCIGTRNVRSMNQGKLFNIKVIQVYAPTSNAGERELEWF